MPYCLGFYPQMGALPLPRPEHRPDPGSRPRLHWIPPDLLGLPSSVPCPPR